MGSAAPAGMAMPSYADMSITMEKLNKNELAEYHANPGIVSIAHPMPVKLIEPLPAGNGEAIAAADAPTWGLEAVGAAQSAYSGAGVKVAVLDTGIDPQHAAFDGVQLVRHNFTAEVDDDIQGHGTHVAGTILGRNVDGHRIGVAPGIETAIIGKVLGAGASNTGSILKAIQWAADQGASIICMSLGIDFVGYVQSKVNRGYPQPAAISEALAAYMANVKAYANLARYVATRGEFQNPALLVAASGNESQRYNPPVFEINHAIPAAADPIVSVGALEQTPDGMRAANFSNTGVEVVAPGMHIASARLGGGLVPFDGTSMAAPHVAGVLALWAEQLQNTGQMSIQRLRAKLVGNATQAGLVPGFDPADVGAGLVQAP